MSHGLRGASSDTKTRERAEMNIFASFIPYNAFTTTELLVKPLQAHVHKDLFPDHCGALHVALRKIAEEIKGEGNW